MRWRTEITEWAPPFRFADRQVKGPYRLWHHVHDFRAVEDGTVIEDTVHYNPFGGRLVHELFVRRDLERIFTFRQEELRRIFGASPHEPSRVEIGPVLL
jgi:ligand-binding SRPBCC domain-containing protein